MDVDLGLIEATLQGLCEAMLAIKVLHVNELFFHIYEFVFTDKYEIHHRSPCLFSSDD